MTTKQTWVLIGIVILILLVVGVVFFVHRNRVADDVFTAPQGREDGQSDDVSTGVTQPIVITHNFSDGTHRFGGSVPVPTPCHSLTAEAEVAESYPEQITIRLQAVAPASGTVCTQNIDTKSFDLLVTASADARLVGVFFNRERIPFEVFEESKG